ncbi:MAG: hypothetical protein H0X36_05410 [Sphingomonadaceae bacterium]|nr:hypothetical protein [Sphingomonadaceae bacterium]
MFEVTAAIVCDIVRSEGAGKLYCLGIYPSNAIAISNFEIPGLISFYIDIRSELHQEVDAHFILEDRINNDVFVNFSAKVSLSGWATAPLTGGPYQIKPRGPTTINFSALVGDQRVELAVVNVFAKTD